MTFSNNTKSMLQPQYTSHLVDKFYKPLLNEADLYQRVSGYFSTAGLDLYAEGLEELAKNGGKLELIISKEISTSDYTKIKMGYDLLDELRPLRLSERNDKLNSKMQEQLGNLAFMIAMGRARVKIALTNKGIFHDKFGIISSESEKVFFNGSANETRNGISQNYESISVDVSWDVSENVRTRIKSNIDRFNRLWNDIEPGVKVIEASEIAYSEIARYQTQSQLKTIELIEDNIKADSILNDMISFHLYNGQVTRTDTTIINLTLTDRKLRRGGDLTKFFEEDNKVINSKATYKDIEKIIKVTKDRAKRRNVKVHVSEAVQEYLIQNKYSIEQYKILGNLYKGEFDDFPNNKKEAYKVFCRIVQSEVSRPLYEKHLRSAFFEYEMARAANFSVPGAGKTAMILGVFAYLNRKDTPENEKINRILVCSPINSFESWKSEFKNVFGNKKDLKCIDSQSSKDFSSHLNTSWGVSNLVLVNYESLPTHIDQLKRNIDSKTMLVFDEVHRIKNPNGKRARKALELSKVPKFKYTLTGTPIPNSYQDIYNFLHILYGDEYDTFFGWDTQTLLNPMVRKIEEINQNIYPFFWRTNKNDLNVPPAEADIIKVIEPSFEQLNLAEAIYFNETSSLAKLIRLIQASTNPSLVNTSIDYNELMFYDDDGDVKGIAEKDFNELLNETNTIADKESYSRWDVDSMVSPKFTEGIKLVVDLVSEGKKVLVWAIFIGTMKKITEALRNENIKVNLVYGATEKSTRVSLIDEFRDGEVQVLVSNPQTLGESISLHQTVHDAVYFEYDFNLMFMLQSRDRIHRLGINKNQYTRYYYLQTKSENSYSNKPGYIDQKIYMKLEEKKRIMYDAIDNQTLLIEYSNEEIQNAISIIDEERERINRRR